MAAYIIASYDIADPKALEPYVSAAIPPLTKYRAEVLVCDFDARALEGQSRRVNVVIRFESLETTTAFYNDPEYAPRKALRIRSTTNTTALAAAGFVSPS